MPGSVVHTVIVGAGSAGGVLAARLTEAHEREVMVLEAGPDFAGDPPREVVDPAEVGPTGWDWGLTADLGTGRRSPVFAGRLVGGSSATNNVMALRGRPGDYDAWAEGWSYDELAEAFARVETDHDFGDRPWHGTAGPVPIARYRRADLPPHQHAFLDACAAAGHPPVEDHNAPGAVGAGPLPLNADAGVRQSTALTYLATARDRPNLTIQPDTVVDRVLFEHGRAVGVQCADGHRIAADEVILAAGAYGSPAVLLRSGIGPGAQLRQLGIPVRAELPGVGANLHDHPLLRLGYVATGTPEPLPCQTLLTLNSAELQIFPSAIADGGELSLLVALLRPVSRGRVRLVSGEPHAAPAIDVGLLTHADDLPRLRDGVRHARALAETEPLAGLLRTETWPGREVTTDAELDAAIRAGVGVYQHPVGTCRMGAADDPGAVVDTTGSVYGVRGLRVVDASTMPTIPAANTNLPTLALAEHQAARTRA
ncbi:GMC family oxidoreductase [Amycolatopsis lurida]